MEYSQIITKSFIQYHANECEHNKHELCKKYLFLILGDISDSKQDKFDVFF